MDKAKKMAEQAQAKLDEVQGQINKSSPPTQQESGPVVEYDKHGRPIQPAIAKGGSRCLLVLWFHAKRKPARRGTNRQTLHHRLLLFLS